MEQEENYNEGEALLYVASKTDQRAKKDARRWLEENFYPLLSMTKKQAIDKFEKDMGIEKPKVKEITLTIDDLKMIESYLTNECELDTLDIMELVMYVEKIKGVSLDI